MKIELGADNYKILTELTGLEIDQKKSSQKAIKSLLEQGQINAKNYLKRQKLGQNLNFFEENNLFNVLVELRQIFKLSKIPRRIECYDISHLSGKMVYGSMVVFIDGAACKSLYRIFKCPEINDDFGNHRHTLTRRIQKFQEIKNGFENIQQDLERLENMEGLGTEDLENSVKLRNLLTKKLEKTRQNLKNWELPDLIIVDGGKGQLAVDWEVLQSFGLDTDIISLAKKEEEIFTLEHLKPYFSNYFNSNSKSNQNSQGENQIKNLAKTQFQTQLPNQEINQISNEIPKYILNQDDILKLAKKLDKTQIGSQGGILVEGSAKFLLQRIRDEAHRFGIKHNRKAHLKSISQSELDKIVGPKTKQKLLTKFTSLSQIVENLTNNELLVEEIVGAKNLAKLQKHFLPSQKF
jgi:excinuclease ABC subunit C